MRQMPHHERTFIFVQLFLPFVFLRNNLNQNLTLLWCKLPVSFTVNLKKGFTESQRNVTVANYGGTLHGALVPPPHYLVFRTFGLSLCWNCFFYRIAKGHEIISGDYEVFFFMHTAKMWEICCWWFRILAFEKKNTFSQDTFFFPRDGLILSASWIYPARYHI